MPVGSSKFGFMAAAGVGGDIDYWVPILNTTLGSSVSWWDITSSGSSEAWTNFRDIVITGRFKLDRDWQERLWFRINGANNNFEWTTVHQSGSGINRANTSGNLKTYFSGTPGTYASYFEDVWSSVIVRLTGLNDYSTIGTSCNVMIESYYGDLASAGAQSYSMAINETIGTTAPYSFSFGGAGSYNIKAGCKAQVYGIKAAA